MQRERRFGVEAGNHHRQNCPITAVLDLQELSTIPEAGALLVDQSKGKKVPAQIERVGDKWEMSWIVDKLQSNEQREYLFKVDESGKSLGGIRLQNKGDAVDVRANNDLVTSYRYARDVSKPYLYPINGPGGVGVTADGPGDHVHHRSLWVAHGDVNGANVWAEMEGSGRIVHRGFKRLVSGPVYGEIVALNTWQKLNGEELMDEERRTRVWNTRGGEWLIDFDVTLKANYGDVVVGDTKEGGTASVRVAPSMTVLKGGRIENSFGGVNEEETWGRRACWCDYSGPVDGEWLGIGVFDHHLNLRHPTHWHVRNYGLMTANVFGLSYFEKAKPGSGNFLMKVNEGVSFRYRIYVHRGDATSANVKEKYLDYRYPPKTSILQ